MTDLRAQRKSQIILSAMEVFGKSGFHKGKVEDIAINAGLGKGTIYEYFKSKEEIFKEMLQYMFETYIEAIKKAAQDKTTVKDKLIAILDLKWEIMMKHGDAMEESFLRFGNATSLIKPFIIDTNKTMFEIILDMVIEGIKRGEIDKEIDPENITILLLSTMGSCEINRIISQSKDMDSETIISLVFKGISN